MIGRAEADFLKGDSQSDEASSSFPIRAIRVIRGSNLEMRQGVQLVPFENSFKGMRPGAISLKAVKLPT
jgi:hypothetical protein